MEFLPMDGFPEFGVIASILEGNVGMEIPENTFDEFVAA